MLFRSSHDCLQNLKFKEYLAALDVLVGCHGRYLQIFDGDPPFWLVAYDDVPEKGSLTAFTFGISSVHHQLWQSDVPEIVISVNSTNDDWLLSLSAIACSLRGQVRSLMAMYCDLASN